MTEKKEVEFKQFKIPKNTVQPVNRRIFVAEKSINPEKVTKAGVILPDIVYGLSSDGETKIPLSVSRYFVVDVAEDCPLEVKINKKEKRKLKRGDEVCLFYPEDAVRYSGTIIFDHDAQEKFFSFDPSELAAVKPGTGEYE